MSSISKKNTLKKGKTKSNSKSKSKTRRVFSKKDYLSGDGMLTTIWGPSMWHYLHTMSFNYPIKPTEEDKDKYKEFILNLQHTLPCKYCRINLKNNFKIHPLKNPDYRIVIYVNVMNILDLDALVKM